MKTLFEKIRGDKFLRHYTVFFSGSMVLAILNYLFHPILGRLLSPSDFGDIQAVLALLAQFGIIFSTLTIVTVNITANVEDQNERNAIISRIWKFSLLVTTIISISLLFLAVPFKNFFNFSSIYPIVTVAVILIILSTKTFYSAYLKGSLRLKEFIKGEVVNSISRIILAITLIFLGFNLSGALLSIIVALLISLSFLFYITKNSFILRFKKGGYIPSKGSKELIYGVLVFFTVGLTIVLYTSDVLIVKHFFSQEEAGFYSGISSVARIIFFLIGSVATILLSSVKLDNTFRENSVFLFKSVLITVSIGALGILAFYFIGDFIIKLLIGEKYLSFSYLLPKVGLVMALSSLVSVVNMYFLALRQFFLIGVSILGIASIGILVSIKNSTIDLILNNILVGLAIVIGLLLIFYVKNYFNHRSSL